MKKKSGVKTAVGGLAALVVMGGLVFAGSKARNIAGEGGSLPGMVESFRNPRGQFPQKNRVTVLLLGKDYNRDKKGMPFTKESRADSIMMLSLDLEKGKVSALSIPRDTRVRARDGKTGKINGTYARGGQKLIRETIGDLLGVTPDYYIALKPDAVKALVDELGGVDVESIDAMNYDDNWGQLHVHLPAGRQTVMGEQAVGFARFREVKPGTPHSKEEGDPRRMARQQQLIRAMVAKGKSPSSWPHVDTIVNTAFGQVETDLSRQQIFALVSLFKSLSPDEMQTASLPGRGTLHGTYFFGPDPKKKQALVNWLLKGDEQAANGLTVVAVQNGTDVPGVAKQVADLLKAQGFDAKSAGNAAHSGPSGEPSTGAASGEIAETRIVYGKAAVAARAQKIAQMIGGGKVVKEVKPAPADTDEPDADVTIVLGRDLAPSFVKRSAQK